MRKRIPFHLDFSLTGGNVAAARDGSNVNCDPNQLIGERFKRRRHPSRERQGQVRGFEGCGMGDEVERVLLLF